METDNKPTAEHETHEIAPGVRLLVDNKVLDGLDANAEARVLEIVRMCKLLALGRDGARARIKECIARLAEINDARGGNEDGLPHLSEAFGWVSNYRTHTADDYRRTLTALVDVLDDEDLARVYEEAEFQLARAMEGGAS